MAAWREGAERRVAIDREIAALRARALRDLRAPVNIDLTKDAWAETLRQLQPSVFPNGGNRVAVALLWMWILDADAGVVTRVFSALGLPTARWLAVRTTDAEKTVGLLSGGNQQKVVLAKWLARSPKLLILDEPTRGVDVGAKADIYALMDQLAGQGTAILMISSDLEEIMGVSDRVLVMHEQRLAGELPREQLSEQAIMHMATGGTAS